MGQHTPPHLKRQPRRPSPTPRLKAGVIRALRPDGVYIGTGEHGVLLNLPGAAAVTERLDGTRTRVEIAIETGVTRERIEHIVSVLAHAGLVDRDYTACAFTPAIADRMLPELEAIARRPGVCDGGSDLLDRRSMHRVDVIGGDRIGMQVATLLAASGIGRVRVIDDQPVTPADVIGSAARLSDVGAERAVVAAHRIKEALPVEASTPSGPAHLIILTATPMPEVVMALGLAGRAHLSLSADPDGVVIGPLVIPGRTACTRCLALHRVDRDRHWGLIELARSTRSTTPSALAAHLTAAHATAQALQWLDTGHCAALDASLHISLDDGFVRPRAWSPHALCGCTWK